MPAGAEAGQGPDAGTRTARRVAAVVFWALNAVAGAALLAVCLATGLGFLGHWVRFFDLLGQPRLQYALLLALGACLALLRRRGRAAVALVGFAVVNLTPVAPLYWRDAPAAAAGPVYRVAAFNLEIDNCGDPAALAYLRASGADFLALVEVTPCWHEALAQLAPQYPYQYGEPRPDHWGGLVLSRRPFLGTGTLRLTPTGWPHIAARVDLDGRPFTLVAVHPPPPVAPPTWNEHQAQLDGLAGWLPAQAGTLMVCGDFNLATWSAPLGGFQLATDLRDSRRGFGLQASWPVGLPLMRMPIDHCLASPDVTVHAFNTGPATGSDHYPIAVDFAVTGARP